MRLGTIAFRVASVVVVGVAGCAGIGGSRGSQQTFGRDVAFLKEHCDVIVLSDSSGAGQVAVVPEMQGRVMTSTAEGPDGQSFGWINHKHIALGQIVKHMNAFGGEDRFWLGPEGGQFSIFFERGAPFDFEHWQTPPCIDSEAFEVTFQSENMAVFRRKIQLRNYSDTVFNLQVDREVRVLETDQARQALGVRIKPSVKMVAFESNNRVTNTGPNPWRRQTGLLSIWILGMFNPSPQTTIVIPFERGPVEELGPIVNDTYFGKVPADRLVVKDGVLFFCGDGKYRSKIGLTPQRAKSVCGSYDAASHTLTIVQYNKPEGASDYVNSMWELQEHPYRGDTVNSYNDGPATPGAKPMGPFYELETSSPAAALASGESTLHTHRTFHIIASELDLDPIAQSLLGVTIAEIKSAL